MKRRNFLKTIIGVVGAAVAGAKIKPAPVVPPAPALVSVDECLSGVRIVVDEACDPDRIYLICTQGQVGAYKRMGYNMPRGLKYLVNNETKVWQGLSRK